MYGVVVHKGQTYICFYQTDSGENAKNLTAYSPSQNKKKKII